MAPLLYKLWLTCNRHKPEKEIYCCFVLYNKQPLFKIKSGKVLYIKARLVYGHAKGHRIRHSSFQRLEFKVYDDYHKTLIRVDFLSFLFGFCIDLITGRLFLEVDSHQSFDVLFLSDYQVASPLQFIIDIFFHGVLCIFNFFQKQFN